jgi:predicted RNase H-like nuclease
VVGVSVTEWIAGVDGCPGGWLMVLRPLYNAAGARAHLVETFAEVLEIEPSPAVIGVDMPIGLPGISGRGGRPADVAARANLGGRQSAVFAVPSRAAVMETDYARACAVAFSTSEPPRKVSKQCFHLFPKIREIDAWMSAALQARVHECHPEVGFWALNGEQPLPLPKKVKSRPSEPGLDLRRRLLTTAGYDRSFLTGRAGFAARAVGPDDLIDAAVCAWTAARIRLGTARRFPAEPGYDATGLRMEIWG